jgi:hypothetical protein
MEQMQKEHDPVSGWLDEKGYQRGKTAYVTVKSAYPDFVEYCKAKNNTPPSDRKFTQRLRGLGYEVDTPNGHIGTVLYYTKPSTMCPSPCTLYPLPTGEQSETIGQIRGEPESPRRTFLVHSQVHSPLIPLSSPTNTGVGNEGNVGNEISGQSCNHTEGGEQPLETVQKVVFLREKAQVVNTSLGLTQIIPAPNGRTFRETIK